MSTYITKRARELGIPAVEATRPLMVVVTEADSNKGASKNSKYCAFAIACRRMPRIKNAYFFRTVAWIEYPDKLVRYVLPPSVQKEIVVFDRGTHVVPGKYRLARPSRTLTLKAMDARNKKYAKKRKATRGKYKKNFQHRTALVRSLYEPR